MQKAVTLLGQAHAHPFLIRQHNLVYFKEPRIEQLGKKIFNRIAVLNSKISRKRKISTDLNQLIEKKPKVVF